MHGSALATNLVQNGSFETPEVGRRVTWFSGQTFDGFWYVSQGSIDIVGPENIYAPYEGEQLVDLNGTMIGGIYQDINITASGMYNLSFAMKGNYAASPAITRTMSVSLGSLFSRSYAHHNGDPWTVYSENITISTPGTYRLSFISTTRNTLQDSFGPMIDDVRLELVPEPASLTAIGVGLASLLGLRRCKR